MEVEKLISCQDTNNYRFIEYNHDPKFMYTIGMQCISLKKTRQFDSEG